MKRSTKIITAIALTLGIVGGATAYGKHQWGDPQKRAKHVVSYVSDELDLDAAQKAKLTALKDQIMETGQHMRGEMKPLHGDVSDLLAADSFDQAKALEMISSKTALINENAADVVAAFGGFLDSLKPEQKAEVLEFIEAKHSGRHWKH